MRKFKNLLLITVGLVIGSQLFAQSRVGSATVNPSISIAENLHATKQYTYFIQAMKEAGLYSLLDGKGPYTVFALEDESWKKVPDMTADQQIAFLKNHILEINLDEYSVASQLKANMGSFSVSTLAGTNVNLRIDGEKLILDIPGSESEHIIHRSLQASNGMINGTDYSL